MTSPLILSKKYTSAEFERLPEFDEGYELIEGRVVKKPVLNHVRTNIGWVLCLAYAQFDPQEKVGRMRPEAQVQLGPADELIPDVAFWSVARIPARNLVTAAPPPDLAVEIWSQHDLEHPAEAREKIRRYLLAGVKMVWLINPAKRQVEVYEPTQELAPIYIVEEAGELSGEKVIPNFKIAVKALFD